MPLADFVHLRVHTAYSLSAGAIRIKELVDLCKAERMPAVAVTDTGNLFGALEVATSCAAAGIQPIIGCEIVLARNGAQDGSRPGRGGGEPDRIVLLAQSETGYRNLLDLVSRSYRAGELPTEPAITTSDLTGASAGLLCLTGPRGPVANVSIQIRYCTATTADKPFGEMQNLIRLRALGALSQPEKDRQT